MSLHDRVRKYLSDNGKATATEAFSGLGVSLQNDGKTGAGVDSIGDYIKEWDTVKLGPKPTLSQLPTNGTSESWYAAETAPKRISRTAWDAASTPADIKAAIQEVLEDLKLFDDQP